MKVLIPTAGIGSRLGDLTQDMNKAMISVGKRPVISHIIDRYPVDTEFIIALGYKGDYLRQYLELAYPRLRISFVDVDLYEGPGSGPGYTLKKCKDLIDQEFVFHANDSIVIDSDLDFKFDNDTMLAVKGSSDPRNYRTIAVDCDTGRVTQVYDKMQEQLDGTYNYIGVAYIRRFQDFVDSLDSMPVEIGESAYFMNSLEKGIDSYLVDAWYDIGNLDQLKRATETLSDFENLPKSGESLYFSEDKVLKFAVDPTFISDRVERAKTLAGIVPEIIESTENFYVYNYVPGEILSEIRSVDKTLESLLNWSESNLWIEQSLNPSEQDQFERICFGFYYDKTVDRVNEFYSRFETGDSEHVINGDPAPKLEALLGELDWSALKRGVPVRFHGDFHFENIIKTDNGFMLLDWRQSFGGERQYGDIYYDLGKLLHGMIINHRIIRDGQFDVRIDDGRVAFDFNRRNSLVECEERLEEWCARSGYDWLRVRTITAVIFLNISPLHHYPYSHLLYFLGKQMLNGSLRASRAKGISS